MSDMSRLIPEIAERHAHGRLTGSDVGVLFEQLGLLESVNASLSAALEAATTAHEEEQESWTNAINYHIGRWERAEAALAASEARVAALKITGEAMASAIQQGVREIPRGGMRGQITNNPVEITQSETWRRFTDSLAGWRAALAPAAEPVTGGTD